MKTTLAAPTALALALAAAFPAAAQSNQELMNELRALRERVNELEKKLAERDVAAPAPAGQWGMTPEQARELNRIAVKTESLQDNFIDQGFKGLTIKGQIDPTFIWNKNLDNASFVLLNNEGGRYTYDNSYFGMAVLDIQKEMDSGTKFRLTLAPERGAGALTNGSIVHEASVSIPLTDLKTRLWAGMIPDWTGYELTLPAGNKLITHNLLFDMVTPTAYTGAVVDITSGKWWTRIGLANVNSARSPVGDTTPSLVYRVDYSKGEFSGFGFSGVHGKMANYAAEQFEADGVTPLFPDDVGKRTTTNLLELDGYFVRGDLSLFGQVSYGQQKKAAIYNGDGVLRDAEWYGVSGTAAYKFMPRFEGVLRADYIHNTKNGGGLLGYSFDDAVNGIGRGYVDDGTGTGGYASAKGDTVGANRWALSMGASYLFDENTTFKLEYRYDAADQPVFGAFNGSSFTGYRKSNHLLGTSVVVQF
jgi:Protein of unknown function (DUF3138)